MGLIIILSVLGLLLGTSLFGGYLLSGDYDESASFTDRTKSLFCMVLRKIIDWIGISIPNFLIAFLFVVVPTSLTVISIELIKSPSEGLYGVKFPNIYSKTKKIPTIFRLTIKNNNFIDYKNTSKKHKKHKLEKQIN